MVGSRRWAAVVAAVAVAAVPVMLGEAGVALAATRPLMISPASAGWTWSLGQTVPGVPALGPGEFTTLGLIACASEGNCAAAGTFNTVDAFLVNEVSGVWRTAIPIPGMATLSPGGSVTIRSLACGSPGNCSAVGWYQAWNDVIQGFVVSEVNGTWHNAVQVPGVIAPSGTVTVSVESVACFSAGRCTAVGYFQDPQDGIFYGFVVNEVNGVWHTASRLPGMHGAGALSCPSPGNCTTIGGTFGGNYAQSEVNGIWRTPVAIPGLAALTLPSLRWLSCRSAGNCTVAGTYVGYGGLTQPLVASEVNGTWHKATPVPGMAALTTGGNAEATSLSCGAPGNCSIGGFYGSGPGIQQAFIASQVNGTWHTAVEVPGTAALNKGGFAQIFYYSLACPTAGNCTAGGWYTTSGGWWAGFAISEINGTWHTAVKIAGTSLHPTFPVIIQALTCTSPGECVAGGNGAYPGPVAEAWVASQS